jgi:hypothetical protein
MNKEEKIYQIKNISEKQIRVLSDALEMYTRLGLLQFDHLVDHMFNWSKSKDFSDAFMENRDVIEYHCREIRNLLASKDEEMSKYDKNGNWSLGIGSDKTSDKSKIAYEIEKDITIVVKNDKRGRLSLTSETPTIVKETNLREEKLNLLINKLKGEK